MAVQGSIIRFVVAGAMGLAIAAVLPAGTAIAGDVEVEVVPTPPTDRVATFNAVSFAAPNDGWAVGTIGESLSGSGVDTLIEHWDGTEWTIVSTPPIEFSNESLTGVLALSADEAWAVGRQDRYGYDADLPILLHWDGVAWSTETAPGPSIPMAIGGSGPHDVWAVGRGVLQHFDGTAWTVLPPLRLDASLVSVTTSSPTDAWVAGSIPDDRGGYDHRMHPYVAHWNGTTWSRVSVPHPTTDARLASVSASSSSDVWAVGSAAATEKRPRGTFALHFDGTGWQRVRSPNRGSNNAFAGVEAVSTSEAWAVGHRDGTTSEGYAVWRTLIEHWDGSRWSVVRSPNDTDNDNYLTSVAVHKDTVWAGGGDGGALSERIDRSGISR